ncbi:ADP-ribose pyrophosphatase, mitochondrial [Amyelois transitella]|uniref:ADP-ribose pyrophosphatase, mitochondrial n=1 Tax=Amyelois transitella TaxID=680683 RepID=UPI00067C033E|nr:ADP-ribose pyrophosphatase, mitochondrial [Amyelois transitella]
MFYKSKYMNIKLFLIILSSSRTLMARPQVALMSIHFKCRGGTYPRSNVLRFIVPDDKVSWSTEYTSYKPPNYTEPGLTGKPWADPDIGNGTFQPKWNSMDGKISRKSYMGDYQIVNGYPLNPIGRTGICGRGILGRWGPNHAADPVVTRWKRLESGELVHDDNDKPILQFVAIKRGDTGEWALPGGMVDPGEKVTTTAVREFQEEAMNALVMSKEEREEWTKKFEKFFSEGEVVYEGYVDDRRNTDNAWMETVAYNFHDDSGSVVGALNLHAGDDAVGVRWVDATPNISLYASHDSILKEVVNRHLGIGKLR